MAVIGVLAGLTIPSVTMLRRGAKRVACLSNLRQVGMAAMGYADDWHGFLPAERNLGLDDPERSPAWFYRLPPYLDGETVQDRSSVFQCPEFAWSGATVFNDASPKSFKFNAWIDNGGRPSHHFLGSLRDESQLVGFFDAIAGETGQGQWGHGTPTAVDWQRHAGKVNVLALDCHTVSLGQGDAAPDWEGELRWLSEEW
jgi:prepilin-type processing-associated H-X9-DG protein